MLAAAGEGAEITHHRGHGRHRRLAASDAGGLPRVPRPAVRLLHPGHGDVGGAAPRRTTRTPTEAEIREGLDGNICRCTGYQNIVKSIQFCQSRRQARRGLRSDAMGDMNDDRHAKSPIGHSAATRREDERFLTGDGQYTDDVDLPRPDLRRVPALAARARPHPLDQARRGEEGARRARHLHRRRPRRCQGRRPALRLADPQHGRHADEGAGAPGARAGQGAPRRRPGRAGRRRDARRRPRTPPS